MTDQAFSPLTVVGAGPAGIMAAYTAAEAGADVTLIDDNPLPGGQYFRQSPSEFKFSHPINGMSGRVDAPDVLGKLPHPKIRMINHTQVWGVFEPRMLALADQDHSSLLQVDRVILATGAYDRPIAFPGWTLPGVFGAGATLRMLKTQWVLPGKRVLLAGLGPLQLALADALLKAGADVVCVAEAANPYKSWQQFPKFWGHWGRLREAVSYMTSLRKHHVPLLFNHAIIEAFGNDQVDENGAPIPGTERQFDVDAICLGYGLLPSFQLAAAFGSKLRFDKPLGWYAPVHNRYMETTQEGVFVAGDVTDISGAKVAMVEGQIAGLTAAHQLGLLSETTLTLRLAPIFFELWRLNQLASALREIYAYRPGLSRLARQDTLLCRCEEVTYGQVKDALANGAADLHQVKLATRGGMGYCQGRFCSVLIAPLIAEATGQPLSEIQPFTVRPPIQPIPLRVLAKVADQIIQQ
jgi:NADPH-dependent 2,4-dienoyl-CoA reductase/sulfur reductase-like enzyme